MQNKFNDVFNLLTNDLLKDCVSKIVGEKMITIKKAEVESIAGPSLNFITDGIFRISGTAYIQESEVPWSLILKIIKQAAEEEKK